VTNAGVVGWARYDWGVADVQKWDARLGELLAKAGVVVPPPSEPIDWDEVNRGAMEEWKAAKVEVLLRSLPSMYRNAEPRHDVSRRWLAAYDEGRCVNLGIFGPARVGKTWEAAGIARQLLLKRVPVLMVRVPEMLDKLRPNQDGASDLGQFQSAPVLILDDLGAGNRSPWVEERMYLLTDYRSRNLLPTIATSNMPIEGLQRQDGTRVPGLADVYSDRLLGRLFENAAELVIRERPPELGPTRFGADL
jgi:hypothetical protein